MRQLLTTRTLVRLSAIALFGTVAAVAYSSPEVSWFSDVLLAAAMALAVFADGWFGALLALALTPRVERRTRELSEQMGGRLAAEQTLRSSEERYRSVFDQANDIIFTLSADGVITSINPSFERVLGWPCSEWIGRPFSGLMPPDAQTETEELFATAVRDGSLPLTQAVVLSKAGSRVVLEATLVEQVLNQQSVGFLGIARDVTAREGALARLRRSEQQLLEAQRIAHVGMFERDFVRNTLWWSDEMYRIHGLDPTAEPIDIDRFVDLIPLDERPHFDEVNAILMVRGEHAWELRVKTSDGKEKILSCRGHLVRDGHGGFSRIVGTAQDVTEKKFVEQRLGDSEERFRLLARATSDAVWDLDLVTGQVWRGDGYESLFGYAKGELAPTVAAWNDLVHPDDQQRLHDSWSEAVETGALSWSGEYRFRRADGTYANILDNAYIVRDAQKRPSRMLGAMVDITERKQLEEQVEQAKRVTSLGRVAASIAHEVNNVLMGIQPNAEVIQRRAPAELRHVSDNIIQAVRRGKRVTDEILRFTRPADPALQCVQVRDYLDRWTEEIRPSLGTSIDLRIEADADVYVLADPLQLGQVLTNLALNARDAVQDRGGKLTISAELAKSFGAFRFGVVKSPDRFVHLVVRDEGCGMSVDRLTHIFEPLFTTKKGGIGLGLAITYQIVTRHNGHIFVESEVGKGSTFHVFLPTTLPAVIESEAPSQRTLAIPRLLLVEDEPIVASGIAMLMELEGIKVDIVSTGREAVGAIARLSPDAVVLDIGLPDVDGVTVYLEIQERWPDLPVLFSSGHGDSAKLETYLARPNVGFILKPYAFDAIREALAEIVPQSQAKAVSAHHQ